MRLNDKYKQTDSYSRHIICAKWDFKLVKIETLLCKQLN